MGERRDKLTFGVLPYDDGSGVQFNVTIYPAKKPGDEDEVWIEAGSDTLIVSVREWVYLREAIDAGIGAHLKLQSELATKATPGNADAMLAARDGETG